MEHQKGTCFMTNDITYDDCIKCGGCSLEYIKRIHKNRSILIMICDYCGKEIKGNSLSMLKPKPNTFHIGCAIKYQEENKKQEE